MNRYLRSFFFVLAVGAFSGNFARAQTSDAPVVEAVNETNESFVVGSLWKNHHAVQLESDGSLPCQALVFNATGHLVPAANVPVVIMHRGKAVPAQSPTDAEGYFQATVAPGIYTFILGDLSDRYGFACTAVRVVEHDGSSLFKPAAPIKATADSDERPVPKRLEIALIRPKDVAHLRALLVRKGLIAQQGSRPNAAWLGTVERDLKSLLAVVPTERTRKAEFADARRIISLDLSAAKVPYDGPWHNHHEAYIGKEGGLRGNLKTFDTAGELVPVGNAELSFVYESKIHRSTDTTYGGAYSAEGLTAGVYSVIAANSEGFGCYGIKLSPTPTAGPNEQAPATRSIAFKRASFGANLQEPVDLDTTIGTPQDTQSYLSSVGSAAGDTSTAGDSTSTGGGGGGGGGGGEGLAALAAAAGLALAASDDGSEDH